MQTLLNPNVSANGLNFNVRERGAGEVALVFLHYFGGSSRSWDEVTARLPDFRCLMPDLRGFGDSQAPNSGYSVDEQADDIAALIEVLGVEHFVLVGHSLGGKIALALAARRPKGLQRLVLLAPSPPTPEPMPDEERARLLIGFGDPKAAEHTARLITARAISPAIRSRIIEDNLRSSPEAWHAWLQSGSREDISERMKRIEVPVLVLAGECDAGMTPDLLRREVVERIGGAQERVVPGAGHLLPLEAPDEVALACGALSK
jgi:3-oxoadipate enol-lactonase